MSAISYKAQILGRLLEGETLCSSDFYYSNSNQYFGKIKDDGVELIEVRKPNKHNRGYHLARTLKRDPKNLKRAMELHKKYLGRHYSTKQSAPQGGVN